ncbi:MAG: transcriptional repressor LexA [Parcubacteria group bacterium]|nr:transcriptional repressor LexA [Parcubacteria group bacterium]
MSTLKQQKVLSYIQKYQEKKGYAPSLKDICKRFRLSSQSNAHYYEKKLEEAGLLKKESGRHRGVSVVESQQQMVQIPLLGIIAAGAPIEAIENKETIAVSQSRLPLSTPRSDIYALKVRGDSMVEENINDGDIVLVKGQRTAENGQKIVALLDNSEATLKTFYKESGKIRLQPANKNYESLIIEKGRDFAVQGVVIDVVRSVAPSPKLYLSPKAEVTEKYDELPLNKIICGDAIEEMRKMPDESVDVIIADPPYNIGKDFGNNKDKRTLPDYIAWTKEWSQECLRLMKPQATMFIYGFSEILAHISVHFPLNKQRWLIWHYTNKNVASYNFWQRSHEALLCVWKENPLFYRDAVREPYTEGFLKGAAGKKRKGTLSRFGKNGVETVYKAHEGGALPRDVIKIPALAGGAGMNERWFSCEDCNDVFSPRKLKEHTTHNTQKHPTQKPLELTRRLIRSAIGEHGKVILVPFVGTGSECVVAKELSQNYIGFEINPNYIKIAQKWLATTKVT